MSKDIRSFFAPVKKDAPVGRNPKDSDKISVKKRNYNVIESDDDDDDFEKHQSKRIKDNSTKPDQSADKKISKKSSKVVDLNNFFGEDPVKQKTQTLIKATSPSKNVKPERSKETKKSTKRRGKTNGSGIAVEQHFDDDFEATLSMIDEEQLGITPKKVKVSNDVSDSEDEGETDTSKKTPDKKIKSDVETKTSGKKKIKKDCNRVKTTPKHSNIEVTTNSSNKRLEEKKVTPKNSRQAADESKEKLPCDSDHKRKANAEAYQRFLQRGGAKNPGSKEIPKGSPNCLNGKTFVISGVLDSLEREEATELIHNLGGRCTSSVSKKTSYIVLGEEPGQSKLKKAEQFNIPQLSEDGLLDLIRSFNPKGTTCNEVVSEYFSNEKNTLPANKKSSPRENSKKVSCSEKLNFGSASEDFYNKASDTDSGIGSFPSECDSLSNKRFNLKSTLNKGSSNTNATDSGFRSLSSNSSPTSKAEKLPTSKLDLGDALWVDKYKPKTTKAIIGQNGDRSNVKKLTKWLTDWLKHHGHSEKKKAARPAPWAQGDDGSYYKAALLSGPPGVGKTTSVQLVCQELGFDYVEFNASDTRSKKLLSEHVSELLVTKSIKNLFTSESGRKHVLVMDEVDGMAGNEDRGGVQELIQLIKNTKIPIICMCNDRSHPKMRSLVNYCFDLRYNRPRVDQIKGAMMSICYKEGIKISPEALNDIISCANQDIRQVLHNLSLWAVKDKGLTTEQAKIDAAKAKKSLKMGPWDVARQVFSQSDQEKSTLREKEELFFQDYSLGPLFVQDTYIHVKPFKARGDKKKALECLSRAADSLSWGDVTERKIRSQNAWGLLPVQAIFSSVVPGYEMAGHVIGQITFPAWLGKNSKRNRMDRLLQELHVHTRLSTSGSKQSVNLDYSQYLRDAIIRPLCREGSEGVSSAIEVMKNYQLLREDLDSLVELCQWPLKSDPYSSLDSKIKAAFTRAYNKESPVTPYAATAHVKKSKSDEGELLEAAMEEGEDNPAAGTADEDKEEEDDVTADAMIKKGRAKKTAVSKKEEAGSSNDKKGKGSRKGKETKGK